MTPAKGHKGMATVASAVNVLAKESGCLSRPGCMARREALTPGAVGSSAC
jgi:hypothetical protein